MLVTRWASCTPVVSGRTAGSVWVEAFKSACGFEIGVAMSWLAVRFLSARGVHAVETQTLFWFGATIVGIALLSRQFLTWHVTEQLVALVVLRGIGWLLVRTALS